MLTDTVSLVPLALWLPADLTNERHWPSERGEGCSFFLSLLSATGSGFWFFHLQIP